jgi:hypothetical protein
MATAVNYPNLYQLSGEGLQISYLMIAIDGKAHLIYQDPNQMLHFSGEEIHRVETDLGAVVSVTIRRTVDMGSTTFTVLLPRVSLVGEQSIPIRTDGITTLHKFSVAPTLNHGQLEFYTITRLEGSASHPSQYCTLAGEIEPTGPPNELRCAPPLIRVAPSGVFPTIFDPPISDLPPQPGPFVYKTDSSLGELVGCKYPEDVLKRAQDAALYSEQVQKFLQGNKRYAPIGVDVVRDPNVDKTTFALARLVIYNYTDDLALEVRINLNDFQITSVTRSRYQPPLSPQELDHAIELATSDNRIAGWLTPEIAASAILANKEDDLDRLQREVLVLFGSPNARSSQFWCLVDLSDDTIREVGQVPDTEGDQHHD